MVAAVPRVCARYGGPALFSPLAEPWPAAQDQRPFHQRSTGTGRPSGVPAGNRHRQPERRDHRTQWEIGGFDAGKRIERRKRHIVTDTLGLTVGLVVYGSDVQDCPVLVSIRDRSPKLCHIDADGA
ncbi:transposase [Aureimonas ureilytica]|uniref:transposase n=1 Tax=Aureimonas ureilytica TaxID=401562 RepID=UPI003D2EA83D